MRIKLEGKQFIHYVVGKRKIRYKLLQRQRLNQTCSEVKWLVQDSAVGFRGQSHVIPAPYQHVNFCSVSSFRPISWHSPVNMCCSAYWRLNSKWWICNYRGGSQTPISCNIQGHPEERNEHPQIAQQVYQVNTDKWPRILLNQHFIATLSNSNMFQPLKGDL
jgi:hypothetical protein